MPVPTQHNGHSGRALAFILLETACGASDAELVLLFCGPATMRNHHRSAIIMQRSNSSAQCARHITQIAPVFARVGSLLFTGRGEARCHARQKAVLTS